MSESELKTMQSSKLIDTLLNDVDSSNVELSSDSVLQILEILQEHGETPDVNLQREWTDFCSKYRPSK